MVGDSCLGHHVNIQLSFFQVRSLHSPTVNMLSEVAVTSSSADSLVYIWDLRSGAILGSLKGNKSDARTTATLPIPAHSGGTLFSSGFLAAQNDRALVHVWNWTKVSTYSISLHALLNTYANRQGQLHAKFVLPEKLSSLAISHSGLYCVGGGQSGRVYIWQVGTSIGSSEPSQRSQYKLVLAEHWSPSADV